MHSKVKDAQDTMQRERAKNEQRLLEVETEFNDKERRLLDNLKKEKNALIQEQIKEIQAMQGEFAQASELMDLKYKQLSDKFMELQELYENRPSRPEDLEMIRQLQEEIVQKDNLLKKAAEDMKFYKLELINREDSYNKMFGTNPNVGVLNPLAGKPQTGKQGTQMMMVGGNKPGMGMGIGGTGIGGVTGAMNTGGVPVNQKDINRKNSRIN